MSRREMKRAAVGAVLALALLAGCAAGPGLAPTGAGAAGFWQGLWHGLIAPVTFFVSLFNAAVSIYEVHNDGHFYDAGFLIGLSIAFGSIGRGSCAARWTQPPGWPEARR